MAQRSEAMLQPSAASQAAGSFKRQNSGAALPRDTSGKFRSSEEKHHKTPVPGVTFYVTFEDLSPTKRETLCHGRREGKHLNLAFVSIL